MLAYGTLAKSRFRVIRFTQPRETLQTAARGASMPATDPTMDTRPEISNGVIDQSQKRTFLRQKLRAVLAATSVTLQAG